MEDDQPVNITDEFQVFHSFVDEEPLEDFIERLKELNIQFIVEGPSRILSDYIVGVSSVPGIAIKLYPKDFERAHKALGDYYDQQLSRVDNTYHLFGFSDNELYEILEKPDEWGYLDYRLARKILADRGRNVDDVVLSKFRQDRLKELATPGKASHSLIVLGYCFFIFGAPVSILIGRHILKHRKVLPNGEVVPSFSDGDRKHARIIIRIGAVVLVLCLIYLLYLLFNYLKDPW